MLILSRADVERLLDAGRLVDRLATAMVDLSAGRADVPPRIAASIPSHDGALLAMPAFVPSLGALTAKLVTVFPRNVDRPSHQAVVVCFDPDTGDPLAVLDGGAITAERTAAGSVLAARWMARADASSLAVLGTGVQARAHARAFARSRALPRIVVWGRRPDRAAALARSLETELERPIETAPSPAAALATADIVCAATHAGEPIVRREWLRPGTHVSSVGFNVRGREVDAATVASARVVVESRAAALAPPPVGSTDLLWAVRDGDVPADFDPAEIGEIIDGRRPGRTSPNEITLYKSVGVGVQDAAAAMLVLEAARRAGAGLNVIE